MSQGAARLNLRASTCRFCGTPLERSFVDLGVSPPANSYLRATDLQRTEPFHPLHAFVCEACLLVQLEEFRTPEQLFSDYAYFSSYSETWLRHAEAYVDAMITRFGYGPNSRVVEIASNDGYLLQFFKARNIPVLGIEPAANVAKVALEKGIPTLVSFFGRKTAHEIVDEGGRADLVIGNNVLAHVPRLNDFVAGLRLILKPDGVVTMEFPHLMSLIAENQFDTIYHEHFSYFSFGTAARIFEAHGLRLFDVEKLPTHGGSIRIYGCLDDAPHRASEATDSVRAEERQFGLDDLQTYERFSQQVERTKHRLLMFLIRAKAESKSTAALGAPAKGNTLLNYCGIRTDLIDYAVDNSPHKQGLFLPGTHIPIHDPGKLRETRPDYGVILPWNLKDEIMETYSFIREWGGRFVVPIPEVRVYE